MSSHEDGKVGVSELKRAAKLIKEMGAKPHRSIDEFDKSFWLCPVCMEAYTNAEYEQLDTGDCCGGCEATLELYSKVIWGRDLQ